MKSDRVHNRMKFPHMNGNLEYKRRKKSREPVLDQFKIATKVRRDLQISSGTE